MRRPSPATASVIGIATALLACRAGAEEGFDGWNGPFQLLLRGVYLEPQNHSATATQPQLHLDGGFYGELSAAWFMTPVVSMELSLAEVSSFNSSIESSASISSGAIRLMPNTYTLQYDFAPESALRPYLGVGLHYTILAARPTAGSEMIAIESSKLGWVLQAGLDLRFAQGWFLNADLRYLGGLEPQMVVNNTIRLTGYINPLLIGGGIGYRW